MQLYLLFVPTHRFFYDVKSFRVNLEMTHLFQNFFNQYDLLVVVAFHLKLLNIERAYTDGMKIAEWFHIL